MKSKIKAFSLLEIITVLVIIGIISALLASGVSAHKNASLVSKTRLQFLHYESAINMYCKEYGSLPTFFGDEELIALGEGNNSEIFIKILSGRDPHGKALSMQEKEELNPKGKSFHSFSNGEFFKREDGSRDYRSIVDAFNNRNIYVIVESPFDEDTTISREKFPESIRKYIRGNGIRNSVVIYSVSDDNRTVISNSFDQRF
jgi:prepilin-type N-terminal cleavage/methylation domain-containing protein